MTVSETVPPPAAPVLLSRSRDIILIGVVAYGLLALGLMQADGVYPYGQNLYDEYFLAILDGHLDLPPRVAQVEGHYTPDGTAYLYHGIGPLLTRFLVGWVWPFEAFPLAPVSIWFWACLGTLCYHAAFARMSGPALGQLGAEGEQLGRLLSIAIWLGGPGILLAASTTFYHEPIVLAFALSGGFVFLWSRHAAGERALWQLALPCALFAAIALHARPNVAVGLYLTTVLLLLWLSATALRRHWLRIGLAFAILGAGGLGYLALNEARFGSAAQTHGSFDKSASQYGSVFWGTEDADSERAAAFKEHGKFNIGRIPHNLAIYLFDPPRLGTALDSARDRLHAFAHRSLAGGLGFIRIERPFAGLVFLWPLWLFLAGAAIGARRSDWRKLSLPLAGTLAATVLTLAYGTVTLRYRVDMWPLFALLALLGLSALVPKLAAGHRSRGLKAIAFACFLTGLLVTALTVSQLRFFQASRALKPAWSLEECQALVRVNKLPDADTDRICQPPRIGG